MKTKKAGKKLSLLAKRITSLLRKGDKKQSDQTSEKVKTLQTELETNLGLKQEIKALKSTLKTRKKDLADGLARLNKNSRKVKKDLKSGQKTTKKTEKTASPARNRKAEKDTPIKAAVADKPKVKRPRAKAKPAKP